MPLKNFSPVLDELVKMARRKQGFVDQAGLTGGGGGGAPPGMDPAAAGGAPPPGGDPSAGGGMPPPPPPPAGGGADPLQAIMDKLNAMGGVGGAPGGEPIKPKIDVNTELMQIKNMLAKLCDQSGIQMSAQELTATPEKLTQMAQGGGTGTPGTDAASAGGGGGAPPPGAIPPIEPIQPATKQSHLVDDGVAYGSADEAVRGQQGLSSRAQAVAALLSRPRS